MSSGPDRDRLQDILKEIAEIEGDVAGMSEEDFLNDSKTRRAVLYSFSVIGEAASNLSQETQNKSPSTEWAQIKGMRNYIAHEYFRIKLTTVWKAIQHELPSLKSEVESILRS